MRASPLAAVGPAILVTLLSSSAAFMSSPASSQTFTGRSEHVGVYDSRRQRFIVWGGTDGTNTLDQVVWKRDLVGTGGLWTPLNTTGSPPAEAIQCTAVYDSAGDRVLVYGGRTLTGNPSTNVHALTFAPGNGNGTWQLVAAQGAGFPAPRWLHSAIWDPDGRRMIVFGGTQDGTEFRNDTWQLTFPLGGGAPTWSELVAPGAPSGRRGHAAIYDPFRKQMVVMSGHEAVTSSTFKVWTLPLIGTPTWTQRTHWGQVAARSEFLAVFDPGFDRVIIHGGRSRDLYAANCSSTMSNLYAMYLNAGDTQVGWTYCVPGPPQKASQTGVFDWETGTNRLVWFGGRRDLDPFGPCNFDIVDETVQRTLPFYPCDGINTILPNTASKFSGPASAEPSLDTDLRLSEGKPNPFRSSVSMALSLDRSMPLRIEIFDVSGRVVRVLADREFTPGEHAVEWNGRADSNERVPAGVYWYRVRGSGLERTQRVVLL